MIRFTETFYSIQGEALNTGKLCTWARFFLCSLQCRGFGQKEPGNPDTWIPQRQVDPKQYIQLTEVPTPNVGCDSDYSWSAQFKHLVKKGTPREVADEIRSQIPDRHFGDKVGHVFTGGEPLMQQQGIIDIVKAWQEDGDAPAWIGIETNATQKLSAELKDFIRDCGIPFYFSMSPKLLHVAGEQPAKAISIDNMIEYKATAKDTYLKFVLNEDQRAWDQAKEIVEDIKSQGVDIDVWVMPVGAVIGQQQDPAVGRIADKAIFEYKWNVSPRVHVLIWGDDQIGR